jgi:hypothetical protein
MERPIPIEWGVRDGRGKPYTGHYQAVNAMVLKELLKVMPKCYAGRLSRGIYEPAGEEGMAPCLCEQQNRMFRVPSATDLIVIEVRASYSLEALLAANL